MNAKTFYFSIASALTLGLAICGNAQEAVKRELPLSRFHRINAPKVKRPIDRVPLGFPIIEVTDADAHPVLINGPQPKVVTDGNLYNNSVITNSNGYIYRVAGPVIQEGWCDDVELPIGLTLDGASPATLNNITLAAWNTDTVAAHRTFAQITIYDQWDLNQTPSLVGTPLAVVHFASINPLGVNVAGAYNVGLHSSSGIALNIPLPHDLQQVLEGTLPADYGYVVDYSTDANYTDYSPYTTMFFDLDGVALGDSLNFWGLDDNNDLDFDSSELYAFTGEKYCNFYTRWSGNAVGDPTTEFSINVSFTGLAVTAAPQKVTIDLVPTTGGVPDAGGTVTTLSGTFTLADDPNNPGTPITGIMAYGIAPHEYLIRVKGGSFLSEFVTLDPTLPLDPDPSSPTYNPALAVDLTRNQFEIPATLFLTGDATGDDVVDLGDFGTLVNAYGSDVTDPTSGYDETVDFNGDGLVDITDFGGLVNDYGFSGNPLP